MGLDNENAVATSRPWVVFDIETAPIPNASDFLEPPDLDDVQAPGNYKDPAKIEQYIADAKSKRLEKHARDCAEKAALDWNVGRVVAIGMQTESMDRPQVAIAENEKREREILFWLWETTRSRRPVCGFNIRSFDVPFCVQRSRLLRLVPPRLSLARFENHDLCDLFDLLTFSDTQDTKIMRHTLSRFAQRFGVVHDETISGADIPMLVAHERWADIEAHVSGDVTTCVTLAEQLGVIRRQPVAEAVAL
jgi:hypothetical protein